MNQPFSEKKLRKPRILVAPLDWGLGHATRCIPLVRELLAQDCEVWLATEKSQEILLKNEFPSLAFLRLRGYRVRYAHTKIGLFWQMLLQSPRLLNIIKKENKWLQKAVQEYGFDAVISDNRYGLYHPEIPCIFITHQLTIKSPVGKWSERMLQKRNYRYIRRFRECWVPDEKNESNLAGELSHPPMYPQVLLKYIGPLSRFQKTTAVAEKDHLLFILSGPEPQRSLLENKIVAQVVHYNGTATVIRGLPGEASLIPSTNMLQFYNHLPAEELNKEIMRAEYIISRSGYSTVMDMAVLQKKTILIPTPGQTEQEYLGSYLQQKRFACCVSQKNFSITTALQCAKDFPYQFPVIPEDNRLRETIATWISSLR